MLVDVCLGLYVYELNCTDVINIQYIVFCLKHLEAKLWCSLLTYQLFIIQVTPKYLYCCVFWVMTMLCCVTWDHLSRLPYRGLFSRCMTTSANVVCMWIIIQWLGKATCFQLDALEDMDYTHRGSTMNTIYRHRCLDELGRSCLKPNEPTE